jgi:hypothetical protein
MKSLGFLMLLAGWLIVLSSIALLGVPTSRTAFVLSGIAVEILGLVLIVRAHVPVGGTRD